MQPAQQQQHQLLPAPRRCVLSMQHTAAYSQCQHHHEQHTQQQFKRPAAADSTAGSVAADRAGILQQHAFNSSPAAAMCSCAGSQSTPGGASGSTMGRYPVEPGAQGGVSLQLQCSVVQTLLAVPSHTETVAAVDKQLLEASQLP